MIDLPTRNHAFHLGFSFEGASVDDVHFCALLDQNLSEAQSLQCAWNAGSAAAMLRFEYVARLLLLSGGSPDALSPCCSPQDMDEIARLYRRGSVQTGVASDAHSPVDFFAVESPFRALSNFSSASIYFSGRHWASVEHAYQGLRFTREPDVFTRICDAPHAGKVKRLSKRPGGTACVTRRALLLGMCVMARFTQIKSDADILLATGTRRIIEGAEHDPVWGCGDGRGANLMGGILRMVRNELK